MDSFQENYKRLSKNCKGNVIKRMFVRKCLQSFGGCVMIEAEQIRKSGKCWRDNRYDCICQRDISE